MKTTDLFKWTKRAAGFALFLAIAVGCGGSDCDGYNSTDTSGTANVKAINVSGGAAEHLDFFAHGSKIGDNLGWHSSGPWSAVKAGKVPVLVKLHASGTTAAAWEHNMLSGKRYWLMAYDGLPTLRVMATPVNSPQAGKATIVLMNGDHLRGSLDFHITSGGPPTPSTLVLSVVWAGASSTEGMFGRSDLAPGDHVVYGVKAGTLEVVWSLLITVEAGGSYLVCPVSEGEVPYDPDLIRIE